METDAYIALGSNLGDRELNLLRAVAEIGRISGCRITALSRFYETAPVAMPADTPPFYNAVARVAVTRAPEALLQELQRIEREVFSRPSGRDRAGDRQMDLDLLLFGELQLVTPDLVIPHPRMRLRRFVLVPLAEIAPELCPPGSRLTVAELLAQLPADGQVAPLE